MAGEVGGFSKRFGFGVLCIISVVALVIYFYSVVLYGTGCPTTSSAPISVRYGTTTYSFSTFYCYNPSKWANPTVHSASNVTSNPHDIFLGLCVLPPGWTMLGGIAYSFLYGFYYLIGILGAFKSIDYFAHFVFWSWRALIFNAVVLALNFSSWLLFMIREGQNDYTANPNWVCTGFAQMGWDFCGYVSGQLAFFAVFTILNIISYNLVKHAISEALESNDEVGILVKNGRRTEERRNEETESLLVKNQQGPPSNTSSMAFASTRGSITLQSFSRAS